MKSQQSDQYKDQQKQVDDFVTKLSELAYEVFKTTTTNKTLNIESWDRLSNNPHQAWRIIQIFRGLGIEPVSIEQPINFKSSYARCKLAIYILHYYTEDEDS